MFVFYLETALKDKTTLMDITIIGKLWLFVQGSMSQFLLAKLIYVIKNAIIIHVFVYVYILSEFTEKPYT